LSIKLLRLLSLQVRGRRLDTEGGVRTRARALSQAEQWSVVPLRVKLVVVLTDAYIEATTQGEAGRGRARQGASEIIGMMQSRGLSCACP
jgi:hypothetical protein